MKNRLFNTLLVVGLLAFATSSSAQLRNLEGVVTAFDSIPVSNVEILVSSSKVIVVTDSDGYFNIKCSNDDKLKVMAKGFYTQKIEIDEQIKELPINLIIKPSEKSLNVALGRHISERDEAYAVSAFQRTSRSRYARFTNMYELISSISPSVIVNGNQIIIGGPSSLNGSVSAMIVVDGLQVDPSQLAVLEPMNIASVKILKNSAASLYGVRGANGVVEIKTLGYNDK